MLFGKNLINQEKSVKTYNNFVRQINIMQREERKVLNERLKDYEGITDSIQYSLNDLLNGEDNLKRRMTLLDRLIYWARRP